MKASKDNKEYTIDESMKKDYLARGFDIIEDGKVIEYGKGKTVSYDKYKEIEDKNIQLETENKKLRAENKKLKKEDMNELSKEG